jgi:hypothetical protein
MRAFAVVVLLVHTTVSSVAQLIEANDRQSDVWPPMLVRAYRVDTNAFRTMRRLINAADGLSEVVVFRTFSERKGLDLSPPTAISYSPEENLLVVRSTTEKLDSVEQVVAAVKPKFVKVSEVDPKSVRLTAADSPQPNVTFRYTSKPSQEIRIMAKRYPEAPVLVIEDGLVVAEALGCAGYKEPVGADKPLDYVGLVLVFNSLDEARRAEKTLKHEGRQRTVDSPTGTCKQPIGAGA